MLYFNKIKDTLDTTEKNRSISILNFNQRNDTKFSQDITITQNGSVIDFSSSIVYLSIIPLTSDGIITNYAVSASALGVVSLELTTAQLQTISTSDCSCREFRIRKLDGSILTDIAVGKIKIETYAVSSSQSGASNMIYEHLTSKEGAEFSFTVNTDNLVVTDIVPSDESDEYYGKSMRSGFDITYDGSTVTINLYVNRDVNVYYMTFNN